MKQKDFVKLSVRIEKAMEEGERQISDSKRKVKGSYLDLAEGAEGMANTILCNIIRMQRIGDSEKERRLLGIYSSIRAEEMRLKEKYLLI